MDVTIEVYQLEYFEKHHLILIRLHKKWQKFSFQEKQQQQK